MVEQTPWGAAELIMVGLPGEQGVILLRQVMILLFQGRYAKVIFMVQMMFDVQQVKPWATNHKII